MNRNAILTDNQRLERNQLIEYNRQKRAEENNDDEQIPVKINSFHSQIILSRMNRFDLIDYPRILHLYQQMIMTF